MRYCIIFYFGYDKGQKKRQGYSDKIINFRLDQNVLIVMMQAKR